MRVIDFFDRGAARDPARAAFILDTEVWSFKDAQAVTHAISGAIHRLFPDGAPHAAVFSPNDARAFLCVLGIMRAGGVWVPINVRNGIEENLKVLRNADCTLLFCHSSMADALPAIRSGVPGLRAIICFDGALPDCLGWAEITAPDLAPPPPRDLREALRPATILSTGGTTGEPKGVVWTDQVWETLIANFWAHMPCDTPPVYLVATPMTHAAGVIAFPLLARGATAVILTRADPQTIMAAIERHRVTHLFLPPTVIYAMLAHPDVRRYDYSSLRYFIYSAAPMAPAKIVEAVEVFGPVMTQAYGQVELPLMGTFLSPADHRAILGSGDLAPLASCGRPCLLTWIEIMGEDGELLPAGQIGEIVARGSLVMTGYYKDPAATAAASAGGWHHTGDVGYRDDAGFVYIVDRKKDMIITGGFNVFSSEVERLLLAHPSVQDGAVIGVPDAHWGEAIKAIVELKPGHAFDPEAVLRDCRQRLGGVKTPKTIEVWDTLPRSPVGKVLKREIRRRFWPDPARPTPV